jgi:pimeloyl-ACP methyl ester carboxylesterase
LTRNKSEKVILIHGFAAHWLVMHPFAMACQKRGYQAHQWTYDTIFRSIDTSAMRFSKYLHEIDRLGTPYHIVAHSMGSVVTRAALQTGKSLTNLKSIALLAPPVRGLWLAKFAPLALKKYCPSIDGLRDTPLSVVSRLANISPNVRSMVVAASHDVLVPVANTYLPACESHQIVLGTHNSILFDPRVFKMVLQFFEAQPQYQAAA